MFPKLLFTVGVVSFFPAITEMSKGEEPEQSEPTECECGTTSEYETTSLIINGDEVARRSKYPWMISIQKNDEQHCGGALISPSIILSAAHCFSRANAVHALDSDHQTCQTTDGKEGPCYHPLSVFSADGEKNSGMSDIRIRKITVHPEYGFHGHEYDIALIELQKPVTCGKTMRPICLPSEVPELEAGSNGIIAGWGMTKESEDVASNKLLEANVTVLEQEECRRHGGEKETHICAKGDSQGACMGDSGGPLMTKVTGKFYVYGIVSHSTNVQCDPEEPQFYSNIKFFVDWIQENMNDET